MVPLTSIPSIRFGAGFLARTFARFVKDLVDVAKDIADKKAPQVYMYMYMYMHEQMYKLLTSCIKIRDCL